MSDVIDYKGGISDRITLREKKTNKTKDFPLGKTTRKTLKEYLDNVKIGREQPLFHSRKGKRPMSRQHAYRILNEAVRSVGIKEKIGTHSLRKTFCYHAF